MEVAFSRHAEQVARERGIKRKWIERAVLQPDWTEVDPGDPTLLRYFRTINEHGGRSLRVVARLTHSEIWVVSAFFDRRARRPA